MKRVLSVLFGLAILVVAGLTLALFREVNGSAIAAVDATKIAPTAEQIERGEYLARIGNCAGCHTARGGEPYAGGGAVDTPFGAVYASNLTPDASVGIGRWSSEAFYRAMHEGRSQDGHLLYPAFPYPHFSLTTREDTDAIFSFLVHRVKPVNRRNTEHALAFPYNNMYALAAWRFLYFKPSQFQPDTARSAQWNRGSYLVQGLAHCGACHSTRNSLGAPIAGHTYDGAMMPLNDWYAPSLTDKREASVADWPIEQIARWLKDGTSPSGAALGPMAEIVFQSTQYATNSDLTAMSDYLKSLPAAAKNRTTATVSVGTINEAGKRIYKDRCANCHGDEGKGKSEDFPALAGNRTVTMANPTNLISLILKGGFAPATTGNPRPHGMPPFYHLLTDADIANVASFVRSSWGNASPALTELDMVKYRNAVRTTR
jgi:mono/diheme cytochrome c family protein